jgi:molecular chaperone GrpE
MKKQQEEKEKQPINEAMEEQVTSGNVADGGEEPDNLAEEMSPEEKLAAVTDKYIRLVAEFDNFRKRTAKERLELILTAGENVITGLLPILDDFERALNSMRADNIPESEQQGVQLIYDKLYGYLQSKGLQRVEAMGKALDTDRHEAIAKIPAPTPEQKGKIVDEVEPGYTLNGKIIRYAKVIMGE